MKYLLCGINSRFNHTNIAIRSISRFCNCENVVFAEWTINMSENEILRGIASYNPDVLIFSTYIWNASTVQKILADIKKILPGAIIGLGGPEAGFNADFYLKNFPSVDFISYGEGEETTKEIVSVLKSREELSALKKVRGIFIRNENLESHFTGERDLICDLDNLPFPYDEDELNQKDTKIFYYESSRGCPFSCSYCMSSLDKRVRFKSLEKVKEELKIFLDKGVKLVKLVDRTYNLMEDRYIEIWKYILENHNGITMFHFEIEAEYLSQKALDFLQNVPEGVMQFEIGVQSSNPEVLKASGRSPETKKLLENINRIPSSIHKHLDLIAGLPYEDLASFGKSYDFAISMKPDALQLGFLKVLSGTLMQDFAKSNGWKWMENPPYETFSTPYISWDEMLFLKDLEVITDAYWNSGLFSRTLDLIFGLKTSFYEFASAIAKKARKDGVLDSAKKPLFWFDYLAENAGCFGFDESEKNKVIEKLKYDYLKISKTSNFPSWLKRNYDKEKHLQAMIDFESKNGIRINYRNSEWDVIDGEEILFVY